MLYRALAVTIVAFWVVMTGLLIRTELRPGDSALRQVPLNHVLKTFFNHEQASELTIMSGTYRAGRLRIHPRVRKDDGTRVVEFGGNASLFLPNTQQTRIAWDGVLELGKLNETRRLQIVAHLREPSNSDVDILLEPSERVGRYEVRSGREVIDSRKFPLDENGLRTLLAEVGVDPALLAMVSSPVLTAAPEVSARQAALNLYGENIETYVVSVGQQGQSLAQIHLSQFGHVLRVTTLLGYTLAPELAMP